MPTYKKLTITLTQDEFDNVMNGLSFFIREYADSKSIETKRSMHLRTLNIFVKRGSVYRAVENE